MAGELGVLDRTVLFLDKWIPYEQRYDFLREADIGLTLHRHAEEARLAVRSRYMDYLSAELPCVLGRGDETAEELGEAGFATLLEDPDPRGARHGPARARGRSTRDERRKSGGARTRS